MEELLKSIQGNVEPVRSGCGPGDAEQGSVSGLESIRAKGFTVGLFLLYCDTPFNSCCSLGGWLGSWW